MHVRGGLGEGDSAGCGHGSARSSDLMIEREEKGRGVLVVLVRIKVIRDGIVVVHTR